MKSRKKSKRYLTVAQIAERWGNRSPQFIDQKLKADPTFPKAMRFGGRLRLFDEDEIERYERGFITGDENAA
jgi:predicted DNA-binding transcriptional regulator AlpA